MNANYMKKCVTIFVLTIFIASILTGLSGSIAGDPNSSTESRGLSTRAAPEITQVGQKLVTNDNVSYSGNEDEWMNLTVYAKDLDDDEIIFQDKSDMFDIQRENKQGEFWLGNISFIPRNHHVGNFIAPIIAKEKNGAGQHEIVIYFTIVNTNDPPVLNHIEDKVFYQDKRGFINLSAVDPDLANNPEAGEKLVYSNTLAQVVDGIKEGDNYHFSSTTGVFQFEPDNSMIGEYQVSFKVMDKIKVTSQQTINLTVLNVNDPPTEPTILNPTASLIYSNTEVHFKGRADDPDFDVESADEELNFTWISTLNNIDTTLGYGADLILDKLVVGNHTITLKVTDKAGAVSSEFMELSVKSIITVTASDADQTYNDEKLDLILFSSSDGVSFEPSFSQNYPEVDIVKISSKLVDIDLVITMEMQAPIRNTTGYYYSVYIVNDIHAEDELSYESDALPSFYVPQTTEIYHTFKFQGGQGFINKIGPDEQFKIFDGNKMEFRIKVTYLETISGMPPEFGVFAIAQFKPDTGAYKGKYNYTYDSLGYGDADAKAPPDIEDVQEEESLLSEPLVQATLAIIIIIIVLIVVLWIVKIQKEKKELTAPPSFDYKFVSGLQDQEQYETLYGSSAIQAPTAPGMPGQMPPQPGMPPMGMPPPMPGVPPGGAPPGAQKPGSGPSCPKCGKAIIVGMTTCPHCKAKL